MLDLATHGETKSPTIIVDKIRRSLAVIEEYPSVARALDWQPWSGDSPVGSLPVEATCVL